MTEAIAPPPCPACSAPLTSDPAYVQWCEVCEWNLEPGKSEPESHWKRWTDQRGERLVRRLYDSVRSHPPTARRGLALSAGVLAVAALVHLVTVALVVLAVLLLTVFSGPPLVVRIALSALLIGVAWFVAPIIRGKERDLRLDRAQVPELFALLDDVGKAIGAPRVDSVRFGYQFNAHYARRGWRGREIGLGAAVWNVLQPQSRVALLGHELGHAVNGDLLNTRWVGRATLTLARWQQLLAPASLLPFGRRANSAGSLVVLVERYLAPLVLLPLVTIFGALRWALSFSAKRDTQRREYYADELAARAGGSEACINGLETLLVGDIATRALIGAVRFQRGSDPWRAERDAIASLPASEWERRRRVGRRNLTRADSTHPPTMLRADLLRERPAREALVVLDPARADRIDRELHPFLEQVTIRLKDALGAS